MKVAAVAYDFPEYTFRLVSNLADAGDVDIHLWFPEQLAADYRHWLSNKVTTHWFEMPRLRQPLQQIQIVQRILREIGQFAPDVVHFQHRHLWFNLSLPLLRRYHLIVTIHDLVHHPGDTPSLKTPQFIMDFGYRQAHHLIVHTEAVKAAAVQRLRVNAANVHVIPHLALGAATITQQNDQHDRPPTALFFGRIFPYKGLEYFIKAEPLVTERLPDARFVIAGAGEDFERYRAMMVNPDRFEVHNEFIPDEQVEAFFTGSDVVVLPYVEASQSGVVAHAFTFGKPVIATTVGGLPEMIEHGHNGLLVPPGDAQALADAMVDLLSDPQTCREMGQCGRARVDADWSPQVVARQTLAVYEHVLAAETDRRAIRTSGSV